LTFRRATIAGAGLAGLGAAVSLRQAGLTVSVSDSAAQAGGRCRSYRDDALGLTIDNGNHLVLSGNVAVARFRELLKAGIPLAGPDHADFIFADRANGARWTVAINDGRFPWWPLVSRRRVPETRAGDYLAVARLLWAREGRIDDLIDTHGTLWKRFLEPVLLAALNTRPAEASAVLAGTVLRETISRGGRATRPLTAEPNLGAAFIDPALAWLADRNTSLATGRRLRALEFDSDRVSALIWSDGQQSVHADEAIVLAVPPWVATSLLPGLSAPDEHRAIVNGHFAFAAPPGAPKMLGLLGGTAEWIFAHSDRISVTVSAADRLVDRDRTELAHEFWRDIQVALGIAEPMPPWQVVKERRATFAATPGQNARRPGSRTAWSNLFLAGDWVRNGLPATVEGALRSGDTAARLVIGQAPRY
jgi:squalene-associated FAD-dependent desaturase